MVVYSSAVIATNPELVEAKKHAVPTIRRAEMLAELMRLKFAVTVGGSHGKTTTTSIIASVLAEGGLDPTIVVGGKLRSSSSNVRLGSSRYLVAEADESDGSFVQLPSSIVVITNIDLEHLDFYPDLEAIKDAFRPVREPRSVLRIRGPVRRRRERPVDSPAGPQAKGHVRALGAGGPHRDHPGSLRDGSALQRSSIRTNPSAR